MRELLNGAASRAITYLETLDERPVAPSANDIARLGALGGPLPAQPGDPAQVLTLLDDIGSPATVASAGARYFGFVTGGSLPVTVAANWLAAAWDQNSAYAVMSPVVTEVERITLRWLGDVLRLPDAAAGGFVSGATMANLTALAAARHAV